MFTFFIRNEMHDIKAENEELVDSVRDLCRMFQRTTTSTAVQTESSNDERPLSDTVSTMDGRETLLSSQLSVASSMGDKKKSGLGRMFSRFVSRDKSPRHAAAAEFDPGSKPT